MTNNIPTPAAEAATKSDFPKNSFEEALKVAQAIENKNSGNPIPPQDVAIALDRSPGSSDFRVLLSSSIKYGLTTGSFNSPRISITDFGRDIVEPKDEESRKTAIAKSIVKPALFLQVFNYYKGKKVPDKGFFENTLVRDFAVPKKQANIFVDIFMKNMRHVGMVKQASTGEWFGTEIKSTETQLEISAQQTEEPTEALPSKQPETETITEEKQYTNNAIFIGHGGNKKPLEQLIKILNEYGIPHKEVENQANAARPIPQKVADTMKECGAAILIFTADEKFTNDAGEEIWRPSENVAHELGAASMLYDNRIVIFKEDTVNLATNFSSIGYISFEKDKLDEKGIDLFRELVKFKIISVQVG